MSDTTLRALSLLDSLEHLAVLGCDQCTSPQLCAFEQRARSRGVDSRAVDETPPTGLLCDDSFVIRRPKGMDASEALSHLLYAYHVEEAFTGRCVSFSCP